MPTPEGNLLISRISGDENKTTVKPNDMPKDTNSWVQGSFAAAVYDHKWYVGMITAVNHEEEDVNMTFMQRVGNSNNSVTSGQEGRMSVSYLLDIFSSDDTKKHLMPLTFSVAQANRLFGVRTCPVVAA